MRQTTVHVDYVNREILTKVYSTLGKGVIEWEWRKMPNLNLLPGNWRVDYDPDAQTLFMEKLSE